MGEIADCLCASRCAGRPFAEPSFYVLLRPEEIHRASGEDDVVPPTRGRDEAMEEKIPIVDLTVSYLHHVRLAAIGARRLDSTVHIESAEDAKGIPGAVCIPPEVTRVDAICRRHCRERVRHPDLIGRLIQDEGVRFMKLPPARAYLIRL